MLIGHVAGAVHVMLNEVLQLLLAAAFSAGMSGYYWRWQIMMQVAASWLQVV